MQRYIPTITPVANEMGFLSPTNEQVVKECIRIHLESVGTITVDKDAQIITTQGVIKALDLQQGSKIPAVFLPHIKFDTNNNLTDVSIPAISLLPISDIKNSSDRAHNLLCLLGVLSHAEEFKDEQWFSSIFPNIYQDSSDLIMFSDEQAAIKFVYLCQTLGLSSRYSLLPLADIQLSIVLDTLVVSIAIVPRELRSVFREDTDPLPKFLKTLPDSLVYSWMCGRFQSTLVPPTKRVDELSIDDKTKSFNILLPKSWSDTDYTKHIMLRMRTGVNEVEDRLILSDRTYPVLLWIAITMPFMFNRHARYLWSESIMMRRFSRSYLVVEGKESITTQCYLANALKQFQIGTETLPCYSIFQI